MPPRNWGPAFFSCGHEMPTQHTDANGVRRKPIGVHRQGQKCRACDVRRIFGELERLARATKTALDEVQQRLQGDAARPRREAEMTGIRARDTATTSDVWQTWYQAWGNVVLTGDEQRVWDDLVRNHPGLTSVPTGWTPMLRYY
ncbi:MAG: hypothetical protein M1816_000200 [Peltula sp. TS41687]|nr:MAG: hypothetical protein M1816_000200 [Peltula sp. TS41687]